MIEGTDWEQKIKTTGVSYSREEVGVAQEMTWDQVEPALPPVGCAVVVDAEALATGGVKEFLQEPEMCLKPREQWPEKPKTAKIRAKDGEWPKIAVGLWTRQVCKTF